jgi:hypothetical protein
MRWMRVLRLDVPGRVHNRGEMKFLGGSAFKSKADSSNRRQRTRYRSSRSFQKPNVIYTRERLIWDYFIVSHTARVA